MDIKKEKNINSNELEKYKRILDCMCESVWMWNDEEETIYVVEGPIDSLFLKNAIAVSGSNLEYAEELFDIHKIVLVFDNEPRNKEILRLMNHAIDNHFSICIWPEMIVEKDINDMILSGFTPEDIQDIIEKHTFVNLRAKMEFINWKKLDI